MAESVEELKSLLIRVKEESETTALRINIKKKKTKIMASGPITSWHIEGENVEVVTDFIFWGSTVTADVDCSHKTRRQLFLGRKAMTNLDSMLKSRNITLPAKYSSASWTVKVAERQRIDAFRLWCWRRLLKVP